MRDGYASILDETAGPKRAAIRWARFLAKRRWRRFGWQHAERVSVYVLDPGVKPWLLYQCHYSAKLRRIVVEEL